LNVTVPVTFDFAVGASVAVAVFGPDASGAGDAGGASAGMAGSSAAEPCAVGVTSADGVAAGSGAGLAFEPPQATAHKRGAIISSCLMRAM
jgi:hypothetical protein